MINGYPPPRYPSLKRPKSVDELMPRARQLVSLRPGKASTVFQPEKRVAAQGIGLYRGIREGDKVLYVVLSEDDIMVVEAVCRAIREKGARVDVFTLDSSPVAPADEIASHEAIAFDKDEGDYNYWYTVITDQIRHSTVEALVKTEKYDVVIAGRAGPIPPVAFSWERLYFSKLEEFAGPAIDFPPDLHGLINDKVWEQIRSCATMSLVDPEGTNVRWTNYWDERGCPLGHVYAKPFNIGHGFNGKDDCSGVVAGTLNHMGAYPHLKAYIRDGQVVSVEGGGKYGTIWEEKVEKYKNVKLPPLPLFLGGKAEYQIADPGLFWFFECAIGTHPKIFRLASEGLFQHYANMLHDRTRSGYIHCGFGPSAQATNELVKAGIPWTHVHIHLVFPTLAGITPKGDKVTIINKGHLAALDDSGVRALAGKYGNPDDLLQEAWIPAIPGINVPGDYMKDYGKDPIPWIKKEAAEHPLWTD